MTMQRVLSVVTRDIPLPVDDLREPPEVVVDRDRLVGRQQHNPHRRPTSKRGRGPVTRTREFLDYLADIQHDAVG